MKKALYISLLGLFLSFPAISQTRQLDLGDKVPDFSLANQDGKIFSLKDSVGSKILVIFFYPKGDIVCKKEINAFNDSLGKFTNEDALVIGISQDGIQKLKKFHDANHLGYDLLSDTNKVALQAFGVKENLFSDRITYVVNIAGVIVYKNYSLTGGKKHAAEALKFLRQID